MDIPHPEMLPDFHTGQVGILEEKEEGLLQHDNHANSFNVIFSWGLVLDWGFGYKKASVAVFWVSTGAIRQV